MGVINSLYPALGDWLKAPFSENMSAGRWAALVIFVITIAILWTHVLSRIEEI